MQDGRTAAGQDEHLEWSFGNTDWWVVRCAGVPGRPEAGPARTRFCCTYWKPVFRYVRRAGHSLEDAQDLTQEFFARLLERNTLLSADPEKGKFRSFLLTLLKRFLADQWDREHCQKRGSGMGMVSLDSGDTEFRRRLEPVDKLNPETICERNWARSLLDEACVQLDRTGSAIGMEGKFEALKALVLCDGEMSYADTARKLQLTEANVKVMVYRLRQRLRQLLRAAIEKSGTPRTQVDQELHDLYTVLSQ
jgi:RNA polymerase sigma factor (sigma-70 family)